MVNTDSGTKSDRRNVTFRHVVFRRNGHRGEGIRGGAVRSAVDCLKRSCIDTMLTFRFCTFSQNQAMFGGALYLENTGVVVQNSVFEDNDADWTGGAIYSSNQLRVPLLIKASSFIGNRAYGEKDRQTELYSVLDASNETVAANGLGGAVYAFRAHEVTIDGSRFEHNVGCYGGGAMAVGNAALHVPHSGEASFHISNSHFDSNIAYCGSQRNALMFSLVGRNPHRGGALLYDHLDNSRVEWTLWNSTFYRNRGRIGGGLHIHSSVAPSFPHNISSCVFDGNVALTSAGGFVADSAGIYMMNTTVRNCAAVYAGGILAWRESFLASFAHPTDPEAVSIVEGNTAIYGGGVYSDGGGKDDADQPATLWLLLERNTVGDVELEGIIIRNNTAFRYGGGFRAFNVAASVVMRGVVIEGNTALAGGGIAILALTGLTITDDNGKPSIIRDNIAAVGGGLYYEPGHSVLLLITVGAFESSSIVSGACAACSVGKQCLL